MPLNLPYSTVDSSLPRVQAPLSTACTKEPPVYAVGPSLVRVTADLLLLASKRSLAAEGVQRDASDSAGQVEVNQLSLSQLRSHQPEDRTTKAYALRARPLSMRLTADNADQTAGQTAVRRNMNFPFKHEVDVLVDSNHFDAVRG